MSEDGNTSDEYPHLSRLGLVPPAGVDVAYEELLAEVLLDGAVKTDRTGTGTRSVFARQLRYDLTVGFPRITTKFVAMKAVKGELLWFLRGDMNTRWLQERGISIWDEWADAEGDLGPIYGAQWRSWPARDGGTIDQIAGLIDTLRRDPDSRRMLVSAWNVGELDRMSLAPCHAFFQCYVADGHLSLQVYQRSADLFLGVPFNIASYALLTHMLAQQADLEVGELVWTGGDCHVYNNHVSQVRQQLSRVPAAYPFPRLRLERAESIDAYAMEDIDASAGYQHHPTIKAPVAV
ncbi:MAG: thymidylate synthase [Actinomyces ruminicola]|uniref:Thymidylate synthase n=1 Tax=Actinomyces ruminicola TaxID=332524 RepID=A0A1G9XPI0_9ACTO|nr:thymidylate synthase [Actinomyces ruminicola]MBE6481742.1 thymidylate synthase [Actinomyces ruminicola]SDM98153.1 thymidylate synthase [Actinomyces ruminicola]